MQILSVNISKKKGEIKEPVGQISVDMDGIVSDAHRGPWHRQISLLSQEDIEDFGEKHNQSFEFGAFAENITTSGIDLGKLAPMDQLKINDIVLEITQIGKECHGGDCAVYQAVGICVMPKKGLFARVLTPGTMKVGDSIEFLPRTLNIDVITMSDRASSGVYEDRSGPLVEREVAALFAERWHTNITRTVIPDQKDQLEALLQKSDADIIITTGGTGIGPRDITPDVIREWGTLEVPGIMDMIRLKHGTVNPYALVSRSVAVVRGTQLAFALPGSVKAVVEYMEELKKVIPHMLKMVHGIGH